MSPSEVDTIERRLFQEAYSQGDWETALDIVEGTKLEGSKRGRISRLVELYNQANHTNLDYQTIKQALEAAG